jgi:hypothetical protein
MLHPNAESKTGYRIAMGLEKIFKANNYDWMKRSQLEKQLRSRFTPKPTTSMDELLTYALAEGLLIRRKEYGDSEFRFVITIDVPRRRDA